MTPETSTTLLRDIAQDSQHARWAEFVARYRPMMEAYMHERFPSVEADDVIQETLISLIKTLPVYHYSPEEKGSFHNYLTGILRNKALRQVNYERRRLANLQAYSSETQTEVGMESPSKEEASRRNIFRRFRVFMILEKWPASHTWRWSFLNRMSFPMATGKSRLT